MLSPDQYVQQVVSKYDVTLGGIIVPSFTVEGPPRMELLRAFPGALSTVMLSGSSAKGTAVRGGADVDLFLSFARAAGPLRDVYQPVHDFAAIRGYAPRKQDVSIGITYSGLVVDLVPGDSSRRRGITRCTAAGRTRGPRPTSSSTFSGFAGRIAAPRSVRSRSGATCTSWTSRPSTSRSSRSTPSGPARTSAWRAASSRPCRTSPLTWSAPAWWTRRTRTTSFPTT